VISGTVIVLIVSNRTDHGEVIKGFRKMGELVAEVNARYRGRHCPEFATNF